MKKIPFFIKPLSFLMALRYYRILHKEKGYSFKDAYDTAFEYLTSLGLGYTGTGKSSKINEKEG